MQTSATIVIDNPTNENDRYELKIDNQNHCYNIFDCYNIKCSTDALKIFHRCSNSILERDPELYNIYIDDYRFYSHGIIEVFENEFNLLYQKCLRRTVKPLQGFRWLEGLLFVLTSYMKYLHEFDDKERLDALLNLFYSAWITFFIHNRYAIFNLACPQLTPDANNNNQCSNIDNSEKKTLNIEKSDKQIMRHLDKHLPNFDRILTEAIELGHQLSSKHLSNLNKLEEFYQLWKYPIESYQRKTSNEFNLILQRITGDVDLIVNGSEEIFSPKTSIDWKLTFYDEFIRYANRFYLRINSAKKQIGGERFLLNKWSSNKLNYFHMKNIFKRHFNHEYEKQIEQLYL